MSFGGPRTPLTAELILISEHLQFQIRRSNYPGHNYCSYIRNALRIFYYLCLRFGVHHADDLDLDVAVAAEPVLLDLDLGRV